MTSNFCKRLVQRVGTGLGVGMRNNKCGMSACQMCVSRAQCVRVGSPMIIFFFSQNHISGVHAQDTENQHQSVSS